MTSRAAAIRRRRIRWIVAGGFAMMRRDLHVASQGGGIAPHWLLAGETACFGVSAVSGVATLVANGHCVAARATVLFGTIGVAIHLIRLLRFMGLRTTLA